MLSRFLQVGLFVAGTIGLVSLSVPSDPHGSDAYDGQMPGLAAAVARDELAFRSISGPDHLERVRAEARSAFRGLAEPAALDASLAGRVVDTLVFGAHGTPPEPGRHGHSRQFLDLGWLEHLPGSPTRSLPSPPARRRDAVQVRTVSCLVSGQYRVHERGPAPGDPTRYWRIVEYDRCDMLEMTAHGRVAVAFDRDSVERTRVRRRMEMAVEGLSLELPGTAESLFGDRSLRRYELSGAVVWVDIGQPDRPRVRRSTLLLRAAGEPDVLLDDLAASAACRDTSPSCSTLYGHDDRFDGDVVFGDSGRVSVSTKIPLAVTRRRLALPLSRRVADALPTNAGVEGCLRMTGAADAEVELLLLAVRHAAVPDDLVASLHRLDAGTPRPFEGETSARRLAASRFRVGQPFEPTAPNESGTP